MLQSIKSVVILGVLGRLRTRDLWTATGIAVSAASACAADASAVNDAVSRTLAIGKIIGDDGNAMYRNIEASRMTPPRPDAGILRPMLQDYRSHVAQANLEIAGYRGFQVVRDVGLAFGGAPGLAVAGVFRATVDQVVIGAKQKQIEGYEGVLNHAMRSMSAAQWSKYKQDPASPSARQAISDTVDQLLQTNAGNDLTESERKALTGALADYGARGTIAIWQRVEAQQIDISKIGERTHSMAVRLGKIDAQVSVIGDQVTQLSNSVESLKDDIGQMRFDQLDAQGKLVALNNGALPNLPNGDRARLAAQLRQAAVVERTQSVLNQAAGSIQGLAVLAHVLGNEQAEKTLHDVSQAVQYGQAAVSIFAGFAMGGPVGGLMAIGSMGGMFGGGGSDGTAELRQQLQDIQRTLAEMDRKLDKIIELQTQTLQQLAMVSANITRVEGKVDELADQLRSDSQALMQASFKNVYLGCVEALSSFGVWRDGGMHRLYPFLNPDDYVGVHFAVGSQLEIMVGNDASGCARGLPMLLRQARYALLAGGPAEIPPGQDGETDQQRERAFAERLQNFDAYLPDNGSGDGRYLLTAPTPSLAQLHGKAVAFARAMANPAASDTKWRPCLWWTGLSHPCDWVSEPPYPDQIALLEHPYGPVDPPLTARSANLLADFSLAMYAQPFLPKGIDELRKAGTRVGNAWIYHTEPGSRFAALVTEQTTSSAINGAKVLLEHAMRVADIAVSTEALHDGDMAIEFMADRLLTLPPIPSDGATICEAGQLGGGFIGAREEALYWKYPDMAQKVLRSVMYRLAFFDAQLLVSSSPDGGGSDFNRMQRAANYDYRLSNAPFDWKWPDPDVRTRQTVERSQRYWFPINEVNKSIADTTPLNGIRVFYARPGESREVEVRELQWFDESKPANVHARGEADWLDCVDGKQHFRRAKSPGKVRLPDGWSMMIGPVAVSMPKSVALAIDRNEPSSDLAGLLRRRELLQAERMSFDTSIPASSAPYVAYGRTNQMEPFVPHGN